MRAELQREITCDRTILIPEFIVCNANINPPIRCVLCFVFCAMGVEEHTSIKWLARCFLRGSEVAPAIFLELRGTLLALQHSTRHSPAHKFLSPAAYRWLHISRLHIWSTKLNFGDLTRASCCRSELRRLRTAAPTFMPTT